MQVQCSTDCAVGRSVSRTAALRSRSQDLSHALGASASGWHPQKAKPHAASEAVGRTASGRATGRAFPHPTEELAVMATARRTEKPLAAHATAGAPLQVDDADLEECGSAKK